MIFLLVLKLVVFLLRVLFIYYCLLCNKIFRVYENKFIFYNIYIKFIINNGI